MDKALILLSLCINLSLACYFSYSGDESRVFLVLEKAVRHAPPRTVQRESACRVDHTVSRVFVSADCDGAQSRDNRRILCNQFSFGATGLVWAGAEERNQPAPEPQLVYWRRVVNLSIISIGVKNVSVKSEVEEKKERYINFTL